MDIKQYIIDVETLEKERYGMECTINAIDQIISSLGIPNQIERQNGSIYKSDTHIWRYGILWLPVILWGIAGLWITSSLGHIDSHILWVFLIPSAVISIWMIVSTIITKRKYAQEQEDISYQYSSEILADRRRVEQEKQIAVCYQTARNEMYETYCKTKELLDQMYDLNVVYGKYRYDLVAICMFSEYFQSGRCSTLEGHEGAYNIYENEIRLGTIINKLDEIIVRLDRIEQNQYGLFMAIKEISKQQSKILTNLDAVSRKLDSQNENLEYLSYDMDVMRVNSSLALTYGMLYD